FLFLLDNKGKRGKMAVRIVGFNKLPRSGLVQHHILTAGHSPLGRRRRFREEDSGDTLISLR
ncbi:hypothetical protein J2T13_005364, partial [Paenibacillus sp. DS2015]|uniref:hypothetical protein n=1 Tax=Paenibacillus sp. DS2015 TaxID=3373917 RepID=UPI003D1B6776